MTLKNYNNSGLYVLTNTLTEQKYVGSSGHLRKRIGYHYHRLAACKHPNPKLQRSYNKYGASAFTHEIILYSDVEYALDTEQKLIDSGEYYYNISKIARRPEPFIRKVIQYTLEGDFSKVHESLADASRHVGDTCSPQGIYNVCKGLTHSCSDYRWAYYEENYPVNISPIIDKRSNQDRGPFRYVKNYIIRKWSDEGTLLESYTDVYKLCNELNYAVEDFRKHLHKSIPKKARGYKYTLEEFLND